LRCERGGQLYAVPVDEIESIERGRAGTLLVSRHDATRIPVDRVHGVAEIDHDALITLPPRLAASGSGLRGVVEIDGVNLPYVTAAYLNTDQPIPVTPAAVERPPAEIPEDTADPQLLVFRLPLATTGQGLPEIVVATPIEQVLEICEPLPWFPLQVTEGWVRGIVPWRGHAAPLLDLACCFGLEPSPIRPEDRIVLVRGTSRYAPLALQTSTVLQRVSPYQATAADLNETGLRPEAIRGVFDWLGRLLVIPDYDALV
jgi:chemotaxis signal transduction protein